MSVHKRQLYRQSGVLMIEVLITILVTTLGLLGIAALFARSQQMSDEAYQRYQALDIAHQLAEVISINSTEASLGAGSNYVTGGPLAGDIASCAEPYPGGMVDKDLARFRCALAGENVLSSLIAARGCVEFLNTPPRYRISVAWQGRQGSAAPLAGASNCALGFYGVDDTLRRVVSLEVQVL